MKIDIVMTAGDIAGERLAGKTAVVFDVLRATSVIVTALANGCREVVPFVEVAEALAFAQGREDVVLGGERENVLIPGFHLGNSPLEYTPRVVKGRTVVMTTTNGTKAIRSAAEGAGEVIIGSLLNVRAAARAALEAGRDVALVCAGTRGEFSLEDTVTAGMVALEMMDLAGEGAPAEAGRARSGAAEAGRGGAAGGGATAAGSGAGRRPQVAVATNGVGTAGGGAWRGSAAGGGKATAGNTPAGGGGGISPGSDLVVAACRLAQFYRREPIKALYDSLHGRALAAIGLAADLAWCARLNYFDIAPVYRAGGITIG